MDILAKYQQEIPEEFQKKQAAPPEEGFLFRAVMKISGGAISNSRQASLALGGLAAAFLLISGFLLFWVVRRPSPPRFIVPVAGPETENMFRRQ